MSIDLLLIIFVLFSTGAYLLLEGGLVELLSGFVLLSNGVNVFLLSLSGAPEGKSAPLIDPNSHAAFIDPLPQAMILTAIVIGLGLLSLLSAVVYLMIERRELKGGDCDEG